MVNATEMAKPFGKIPKDWLRTKKSKVLISSLSAVRQISLTWLVDIRQGGICEQEKTKQLDESMEWYSIKRWAKEHNMNWRSIN